ncbi:hypothetical protein HY745_06775 [Candidatus Desantisbacteria bacterium]|nr:hypothetical protein [Candidatus Desantisbacteria bacterium]
MGDNFKRSSGNLGIYIGLGIGLSALIVGIFFLFRFVIFPPEIEEETKSSDIDEILNSIKKENHSESISDAKSAPISVVEVKPQKDNNADNKTAALNEQKIEQKKPVQTTSIKEPPEEKK